MATPEIQIGFGHIYGMQNTGGTAVMSVSFTGGTVVPNFKSLGLDHELDVRAIKSQLGITTGLIQAEEILRGTFHFIPEGSTRANAAISAKFPALAVVTISNLPVIAMGSFTDALNGGWIYMGGGRISGESEKEWEADMPLMRFIGIPSPALIVG